MNGSIALTDPLFGDFHSSGHHTPIEGNDQLPSTKQKRSILNYLFIFHVLQVCLMFAGVVNLLVHANLYFFVYPIFLAFFIYVCVYHAFRSRYKLVLIIYFVYEAIFLLYNTFLAIIMFMYSARTIEFQYLTGTPPYIAEMIGAIELLILPCQCVFFFIMTRIWNGVNADTFLPKGRRERLVIFGILGVLSILTIASLAYAQIMGFI